MDVIIVEGKSRSGKSSSLRYAMIELLKKEFKPIYNSKKYPNDDYNVFIKKLVNDFNTPKGYIGQITIAGTFSNKNICITTYGDSYKYDIKKAYDKGQECFGNKLDIFVCAAHGSGYDLAKKLGTPHPIHKNRSDRDDDLDKEYDIKKDIDNKTCANEIVKEIETIIK